MLKGRINNQPVEITNADISRVLYMLVNDAANQTLPLNTSSAAGGTSQKAKQPVKRMRASAPSRTQDRLEDRMRDLMAQAKEQAEFIKEKERVNADLNQSLERGEVMRKAMTAAAKRKDDLISAARRGTATTIEELNLTIDNMRGELLTKQEELEAARHVRPAVGAAALLRDRSADEQTIALLRQELGEARKGFEAIDGQLQKTIVDIGLQ